MIKKKAYNMYEAKTRFSELVERASQGVDIVLMNRGEPVAKIVSYKVLPKRRLGFAKSIHTLEGFNDIPEGFEDYL